MLRLAAAAMSATEPGEDGERGVVVNTASIAAYDGQIGQLAYSASKGGIVGHDAAGRARPVLRRRPGVHDRAGPGRHAAARQRCPRRRGTALSSGIPFPKRLGRPDDFAELALDIVEHGYLNGEVIRMDGALRMAPR